MLSRTEVAPVQGFTSCHSSRYQAQDQLHRQFCTGCPRSAREAAARMHEKAKLHHHVCYKARALLFVAGTRSSNMDKDYFGLSSPEFQNMADALLIVEDKQLPVHKAILAASSATFAGLFTSCSATTREDGRVEVPLDDSLHAVYTILKYLYHGCIKLRASKLHSFDDAYHVITFAHKYDMRGLLEECEADLVQQATNPSKFFRQPGSNVGWTLLAEKCEMSNLLAHCELYMTQRTDEAFWSTPSEQATELSSASMLRMLKAASYHNNHRHYAPLKMFIAWQ